jgi:hypothetical protein
MSADVVIRTREKHMTGHNPSTRTRRRHRWVWTSLALVAAVLATGCVTDLSPQVGENAAVFGINDEGAMIGTVPGEDGGRVPVRWGSDGSATHLPSLPGAGAIDLVDINNAGEVLGRAEDVDGPQAASFPVMWDATGGHEPTDLRPWIPGADQPGVDVGPIALNNRGVVLGLVVNLRDTGLPPVTEGLYVLDLRAAGGPSSQFIPADTFPVTPSFNDDGVIVGYDDVRLVDGRIQGGWGRWVPRDGSYEFERFDDFMPRDINNLGDMVGTIVEVNGPLGVWLAGAPAPVPLSLAGLPGKVSVDSARINDNRLVVGSHRDGDDFIKSRPVRWKTPDAAPELFPEAGWATASISDVSTKGAVGWAYPEPLKLGSHDRPIRWD